MKAAALRAIEAFVLRKQRRRNRVEIFLHSKSLNAQVRALTEVGIRELGTTLRDAIRNMQVAAPAAAKMYPGAPFIESGTVTVEWDDAPGFSGSSPAGIQLADSLATNMFHDLRRRGEKRSMQNALVDADYDKHRVIDVTRHVVCADPPQAPRALHARDVGLVLPW